jgi:error-prone DNA polymerase
MLAFDKDEVEALGLIKLDLLGLRMLAALERAREETLRLTGTWVEYGELPDDPAVWQRITSGDTMGLFQIESPAQVQMTARLQPKNLTELAHQIALVRPGPIQSGTVHPYVRRARGEEAVPVRSEPLHSILAPTHGTLMYQEQILRIAVQYAGFSWSEADKLRSRLSKAEDPDEVAALREDFLIGALFTTTPRKTRPGPSSSCVRPSKATASPRVTRTRLRCTVTPRPGCATTTRQPSWPGY